jgi:UDP-N-acetylmuramate--alanine ligase
MRLPIPDDIPPADQLGHVHFVGIGGAGLSAIATIMHERGIVVSGSDAVQSGTIARLRARGIDARVGHAADQLAGADTVVVSTAVEADNVEVAAALDRGLRVWPRSVALASLMPGRDVIAVSGTDGKTTTTAMLAAILIGAGLEPGYAIGSPLQDSGVAAAAGSGRLFVVEADESDGAFLLYPARGVVVTNVRVDHLDYYGTADEYVAAFERFVTQVPSDGFVVHGVDDPGAARLGELDGSPRASVVGAGLSPRADVRATDVRLGADGSSFTVSSAGVTHGTVRLRIPGEHYVIDATCAIAAALQVGVAFDAVVAALAGFAGASRRMEPKGTAAGVRVYDSYAHHPDEIRADLAAARRLAGTGRLVVCFQPHLVSRTRAFGAEMGRALSSADRVVVMDVYAAREPLDPDVTGRLVFDALGMAPGAAAYEPDPDQAVGSLRRLTEPGDLVITLGAGDVTEIGPRLLHDLERSEPTS